MLEKSESKASGPHSRWWISGAALVVIAILLGYFLLLSERDRPPAPPTDPPAVQQPLVVTQSVALTVPDTIEMESRSFKAYPGTTYLLSYEITATKPEGSPGSAMYFGVNLACGDSGGTNRSIGGTENLINGERTTLGNHFLLTVDKEAEQTCRVVLSSPNENAAALGSTVKVDVRWSMETVEGGAHEVDADERLPLVVEPGGREIAFKDEIALTGDSPLEILGTLHVTSCTIVNGSREGGATLCREPTIDDRGSAFDIEVVAREIGPNGEPCDSNQLLNEGAHVDRRTHHQVLNLKYQAGVAPDASGDVAEFVVTVANDGPAPLVIHGVSSSFIVLTSG